MTDVDPTPLPLDALIAGLSEARAHGPDAGPVTVCQTHLSAVFLTRGHALKIKKPVRFWGLVDQRTMAGRRAACHAEVRLNRRLTDGIYLGVVPIHQTPEGLRVGTAEPDEAAPPGDDVVAFGVHMVRVPEALTLASHLAQGDLDIDDVAAVARRLARFHANHVLQPPPRDVADAFLDILEGNFSGTPLAGNALLPEALHGAVQRRLRQAAHTQAAHLRARAAAGHVVDGHGDVRLDHVLLQRDPDGVEPPRISILDAVEFSDVLRQIDRLADMAFLAMDLTAKGRRDLAHAFEHAWMDALGEDAAGTAALRALFRGYRAYVRATVDHHTHGDLHVDADVRAAKGRAARRYLAQAWAESRHAQTPPVVLLRGRSGVGKSVVASTLAPLLDARILRSDVIRKALVGLAPTERPSPSQQAEIYGRAMSRRTYDAVLQGAREAIQAGQAAVLDATWLVAASRQEARALAREVGAPFAILDITCDRDEVKRRLAARAAEGNDASDADWAVYLEQERTEEPLDADEEVVSATHASGEDLEPALMDLLQVLEAQA